MEHKEFGGCLPREKYIKHKQEKLPDNTLFLNTGRSAIYAALLLSKKNKILLPYYTCPTISDYLVNKGIEVREYNIDNKFMPMVDKVEEDELILCTDYYGCIDKTIIDRCVREFGKRMIMDKCQSFIDSPVDCLYTIYSPRKFLGVSCGGLLVSNSIINQSVIDSWEKDNSSEEFLDICEKNGSNAAYELYCLNEEGFRKNHRKAPIAVIEVIKYADYREIRNKRKHMFDRLLNAFGESKELLLDYNRSETAYVFPMWSEDIDLKKKLIANSIYCSTWWRRVLEREETTEFEKGLVEHLVPIPIDHRYSDDDISYLIETIKKLMA